MKLIKLLDRRPVGNKGENKRWALFHCDVCKNETERAYESIKYKSCGCTRKHNMKGTRIYTTWQGIKDRCDNSNYIGSKNYKGRGITYPDSWKLFINFYADMKDGYSDNLFIDRRDNDKGYSLENCRWVERSINSQNTRRINSINTTGFRGVSSSKSLKGFRARISVFSKKIYLGIFEYPWTAAYVYDSYVLKHNLEHTRNFLCK